MEMFQVFFFFTGNSQFL